jgi:hypothetical protein
MTMLFFAAMGFLSDTEASEPHPVFMYDGAGGRADVGPEVSFVTPASRFQDGDQLKVKKRVSISLQARLNHKQRTGYNH